MALTHKIFSLVVCESTGVLIFHETVVCQKMEHLRNEIPRGGIRSAAGYILLTDISAKLKNQRAPAATTGTTILKCVLPHDNHLLKENGSVFFLHVK